MRGIWGISVLFAASALLSGCGISASEPATLPPATATATEASVEEEGKEPASVDAAAPKIAPDGSGKTMGQRVLGPQRVTTNEAMSLLESFLSATNEAAQGDGLPQMRSLFSDSCSGCLEAYSDYAEAQEKGIRASGPRIEEWKLEPVGADKASATVLSSVTFLPVDLVKDDGEVVATVGRRSTQQIVWTIGRPRGELKVVRSHVLPR